MSTAILPTGTKINPAFPQQAEYFDTDQTAFVVRDGEKTRVWTSFGDFGESWAVGTSHIAHHDQTLRRLGYFTVIGKVNFATGEKTGEIPNRKLPHDVFK